MKITAKYLNEWFKEYSEWWVKANAEWIKTHFQSTQPSPMLNSSVKIVTGVRRVRDGFGYKSWHIEEDTSILYDHIEPSEFWLNPYEVNYSCSYDTKNKFRMRTLTHRTINRRFR